MAALRKERTVGEIGAAPVIMRRTRPPRLACRGQCITLIHDSSVGDVTKQNEEFKKKKKKKYNYVIFVC